jgi:hypothetical protein
MKPLPVIIDPKNGLLSNAVDVVRWLHFFRISGLASGMAKAGSWNGQMPAAVSPARPGFHGTITVSPLIIRCSSPFRRRQTISQNVCELCFNHHKSARCLAHDHNIVEIGKFICRPKASFEQVTATGRKGPHRLRTNGKLQSDGYEPIRLR